MNHQPLVPCWHIAVRRRALTSNAEILFCFTQTTASETRLSLVGSEISIRDRCNTDSSCRCPACSTHLCSVITMATSINYMHCNMLTTCWVMLLYTNRDVQQMLLRLSSYELTHQLILDNRKQLRDDTTCAIICFNMQGHHVIMSWRQQVWHDVRAAACNIWRNAVTQYALATVYNQLAKWLLTWANLSYTS